MKLLTYRYAGQDKVGVLSEDGKTVQETVHRSMNDMLVAGAQVETNGTQISLSDVELLAPIPRPMQDIICLGVNYLDHADESARFEEGKFDLSCEHTIYFSKRCNEAVPTGGYVEAHDDLDGKLDYEAELAVIIGKDARNVSADKAHEYIFGYTIINDVSARDLQTDHKQWYFGKSLDTFTAMGPWIVTVDEIAFPPTLDIKTRVNGELRQNANTEMLIHGIGEIIEELSAGITLLAGTVIATGTPAGVGLGFDPPKYIGRGDIVTCEIEGIGVLENKIV